MYTYILHMCYIYILLLLLLLSLSSWSLSLLLLSLLLLSLLLLIMMISNHAYECTHFDICIREEAILFSFSVQWILLKGCLFAPVDRWIEPEPLGPQTCQEKRYMEMPRDWEEKINREKINAGSLKPRAY